MVMDECGNVFISDNVTFSIANGLKCKCQYKCRLLVQNVNKVDLVVEVHFIIDIKPRRTQIHFVVCLWRDSERR